MPSSNSKITPTKKAKKSMNADLLKVNSIVKSNLKKYQELDNQKKEERFLQALQYQDKLQRMRIRNQEIRKKNEEQASRSRSRSRSRSPQVKDGSPESNGQSKGLQLKRQLMEKYSYSKLRQLEQKQKMLDDMKQKPLNLQMLAKDVVDPGRKSIDNKELDSNYADMQDIILTSRYKQVRAVHTHREKVDESAQLILKKPGEEKSGKDKLVTLELASSRSDAKVGHPNGPRGDVSSSKMKQNLEQLVQKQKLQRQEIERARRLQNEVQRNRISENLKKLEIDIEKLKKREQKRSKSQRKHKNLNKSRGEVEQIEKKRSKSPEKNQKEREKSKEQDKNVKLLLQKKKIQPNNKNCSLQMSKISKNRKKSTSPGIHGVRSVSNTRHQLSQMQEMRAVNQHSSSSNTQNQKSKKVAISVIPLPLKNRGPSRSKSRSKSKSKSGSRSRSKSPSQGRSLLRENSRTKGPSRSRSGSPSPPPAHKPSHPYLSHLAGERAFHSQKMSHNSMGNIKSLSTRQKIKQIISNQKYILKTKMKIVEKAQRSPKLKGHQQNPTTSKTQVLVTKPDEMKSLQALALNLFNLSEQQLKQERKDKQRKRAAQQKDDGQNKQSKEQKYVDDDQIMNLDLKNLPKTRKSSKDDVKASYATLYQADDSGNNQISLSRMYKQISVKQSKKGSDSTMRSPQFKELTLNQEELNDFQPYENRTPASSKRSINSILPAQIFAIPEDSSSVTLFPKPASQEPAYQVKADKAPAPAQGVDTTQATIQSDKIGPFESSEAFGNRKNLGPSAAGLGFQAQHQSLQVTNQGSQSDIKVKIQNLLQDASSFEVIVTLNNAAIQIQRWYRKHKQQKQEMLKEQASPLRQSVLRRPLSMTPLSLPRPHQHHSSMRSPSVDVNIQSSIRDQVEEEQPKDLDLDVADQIGASDVQDNLKPIPQQRNPPEQQIIRTHRDPISNKNSAIKGIGATRNDSASHEEDFSERRVNQTEQRGVRTESKREPELVNVPPAAVVEHRNQRFFETSLPTEEVDLTSRIEMIDEAISQARHQEAINGVEDATDRQISENQIVESLHGPGTTRDRQRLLSVAQQVDSRQSPHSVLLGDGDRIQTISVVGSVVDVIEDSRNNSISVAPSKHIKTVSDFEQNLENGEDDPQEQLSDFDMKQFEIQSLCEMLQSEMSSDAKALQKQEIQQRKFIKKHMEKMRQHHAELKQDQAHDGEGQAANVNFGANERKLSKDEESKSEVIQQISLRSLNIDGLDSNNEKMLEFTAHITSPDDVELAKPASYKSPEPPREKSDEQYPGQLEAPNLERPPHTSRNEYQPHSHRHMISDQRSSQKSMNLQNIQPVTRPSVDSKFLPKDAARISKISKNLGDNPVSQQVSHRSFLNHAKNLFPDEPAFAEDDKATQQNLIKVPSHSSKQASQRSEQQQNPRNSEKSAKTPEIISFDDQRALQIDGMSAEGQNENASQNDAASQNELASRTSKNKQTSVHSKPTEQISLPKAVSESSSHHNSQNKQDVQILDSQPTLDGPSIQNDAIRKADSSESKISKSFYQNLELFPQTVTESSPERTGSSKLEEAAQSPALAYDLPKPSSNNTFQTQLQELPIASIPRQIEAQKVKISSTTNEPARPEAHGKDESSVTEGQLHEMANAYLDGHSAQNEKVDEGPSGSVPATSTPNIEQRPPAPGQQQPVDGNLSKIVMPQSPEPNSQAKKPEEAAAASSSFEVDAVNDLRRLRSISKPKASEQNQVRRRTSTMPANLANLHRTQPIKPFKIIEPSSKQVLENNAPKDQNQSQRSEARRQDLLSKTQVLPRRRSFDEPFPSSLKQMAERSRSNQKQIAQSPQNRSLDSVSSFQKETAEMIKKVDQNVKKFRRVQGIEQPIEAARSQSSVDAEKEKAKALVPPYKAAASYQSSPAAPVQGDAWTPTNENKEAQNEKKNADLRIADTNQQELAALSQLQSKKGKSLLIDVTNEKVNKDQGALISGRTSSSQQESQCSNAVSQGTLEKRREIGEELERVIGQQIFEQDLDQVLTNVLRRDNLHANKKESTQQKYNEKVPALKEQEEIPEQISLKQAQIQKELDELQQLQGKNEEAKESKEQPATDKQPPGRDQKKANQQLIAGIDTSFETVESYVEDIFQQIRERGPQFLNAFLTPIYHQPLDELHILRQAQLEYQLNGSQGSFYHNMFENEQLNASLLCILNVQLYLTLEKERESVIKEAIEQIKQQSEEEINEEELADMISEADHIHNKAIFDAVNEAMNLVRPYGKQGEPMPWSQQGRKNSFMQVQNNIQSIYKTLEKVLHQVKYYVLSWANTRAGAVHHSQELEQDPKSASQENQIRQILQDQERQKIIEEIINQEILDGQNHEQEQQWCEPNQRFMAQVKLELADHVFDSLIQETVDCLNSVSAQQPTQPAPQQPQPSPVARPLENSSIAVGDAAGPANSAQPPSVSSPAGAPPKAANQTTTSHLNSKSKSHSPPVAELDPQTLPPQPPKPTSGKDSPAQAVDR